MGVFVGAGNPHDPRTSGSAFFFSLHGNFRIYLYSTWRASSRRLFSFQYNLGRKGENLYSTCDEKYPRPFPLFLPGASAEIPMPPRENVCAGCSTEDKAHDFPIDHIKKAWEIKQYLACWLNLGGWPPARAPGKNPVWGWRSPETDDDDEG